MKKTKKEKSLYKCQYCNKKVYKRNFKYIDKKVTDLSWENLAGLEQELKCYHFKICLGECDAIAFSLSRLELLKLHLKPCKYKCFNCGAIYDIAKFQRDFIRYGPIKTVMEREWSDLHFFYSPGWYIKNKDCPRCSKVSNDTKEKIDKYVNEIVNGREIDEDGVIPYGPKKD